jgi:type IV pilus assembly protein PilA
MAQALQTKPIVIGRGSRGFTLVELMTVVVIVGVLAMLAVFGYRRLIQSSHVTEATGMVQNIRLAQEAYHSETQQYADVSKDITIADYPAAPRANIRTGWGAACATSCKSGMSWALLPIHVDGPVLFGYATTAGFAGNAVSPATLGVDMHITMPAVAPTDWYLIAAEGDLDSDPTKNTHVYATSFTNQVFVDDDGM